MKQPAAESTSPKNTLDQQALSQWLNRNLAPDGEVRILSSKVPATGYSALTVLLDVEIEQGGSTTRGELVLRLEIPGKHVFLDTDIARQGQMMSALSRFGIPVPQVLAVESDTSILGGKFLLMDRVEGVSLPQSPNYHQAGLLTELDAGGRSRLWIDAVSTIARINMLNWRDGFEFLNRPQYGEPGLDQYLGWIVAWRDEAMENQPNPIIDKAIARLLERQPHNRHVNVLWGDSNPGNYLFSSSGSVVAVLDFEAAALGPAEIDLAWWFFMDEMLSFGQQRQSGLPEKREQIALFEAIIGRPVADLEYFELLAAVRIALVIARTANVLIKAGKLPASNKTALYNPAAQLLAMRLGIEGGEAGEDYAAFGAVMNDR